MCSVRRMPRKRSLGLSPRVSEEGWESWLEKGAQKETARNKYPLVMTNIAIENGHV